jgi:predicted dehydrogenase
MARRRVGTKFPRNLPNLCSFQSDLNAPFNIIFEINPRIILSSNWQNMNPVRIGVVGLGRFGRLHSLTAMGLNEAELVGVVARREASLQKIAPELPGVAGWTNLTEAIEQSGAEAWIVACSTSEHATVTRTLLAAGKKVLLEKPIAASLAEAESLRTLVAVDSSNLMLGHIMLFNSEFRALQEEVRQRGSISYIESARHRPASIVTAFPGENPLHATMVHDLYMVQALMNCAEPMGFHAQYHRTPAGAIDLALAQLSWSHGPVASFSASYMTPGGMAPRGFDRTEVYGAGWAARTQPNPRPIEVWDDQASWPMPLEIRTDASGPTGMMAEEQRAFCHVVRGEMSVPAGASYFDGLQVQRWMDRLEACANASDTE